MGSFDHDHDDEDENREGADPVAPCTVGCPVAPSSKHVVSELNCAGGIRANGVAHKDSSRTRMRRRIIMKQMARSGAFCLAALLSLVVTSSPSLAANPEGGEVTGSIKGVDAKFVKNYSDLNYKGQTKWKEWGQGLRSLGWVTIQGDSGDLKDLILLVIDTRTKILLSDGGVGKFADFATGEKVKASYSMGWDARHANEVTILTKSGPPKAPEPPAPEAGDAAVGDSGSTPASEEEGAHQDSRGPAEK